MAMNSIQHNQIPKTDDLSIMQRFFGLHFADWADRRHTTPHKCTTDNMHSGDNQFIKLIVLNTQYLMFCNSFTLRDIYLFKHADVSIL